jgi:hypothetical protein
MAAVGHVARRSSLARIALFAATLIFGPVRIAWGGPPRIGRTERTAVERDECGRDSPAYLAAYERAAARFKLGSEGWSILAGIGEVESDHGRSTAAGVSSGQNFLGCCAGPMQIHNGYGAGTGTWGAYAVDGVKSVEVV